MKKNLLLLAIFTFLISWKITAQTCLPGGITFSTQAEIDNFATNYSGCTQILGNVTISGGSITNLNGLSSVISVGGQLSIYDNGTLTSLAGLNGLSSIGGALIIQNNALTNLVGLDALTSIGGFILIQSNNTLTSLTGLNTVTFLGGQLIVANNPALASLTGLNALTSVGGNLSITGNGVLTSLTGLNALTSIGGSLIITNSTLTSVTGLNALTSIGGQLYIEINPALTNLTGLSALNAIGGQLYISNNDALMSLTGLDNINPTTITNLIIQSSNTLSICNVQSICDYLAIPSNPATISGNATGCATRAEVEAACSSTTISLTGNLSFGNVQVGNTSQLTFTINNTGNTPLTVSSISYPFPVFTGNWSGNIAPSTSQNITVTFAPTASTNYTGNVTVNSDAGSGINTIAISGTGTSAPFIGLTVSGNLDFGTVPQGSIGDMPVFLHNNTTSIITIDNITFSPMGVFNAIQNGSIILPGKTLAVSIHFFPPGLSTYNTTFTITSDAPNGNVNFTATGIGGNGLVSWIGVYNQPENNPEITNPELLEGHYITQNTANPIKICADGSKATIVKFINNDDNINISDIVFNMKSDPFGNNTDYTGWFTTPYSYEGDSVIVAKFTHPKYLNISGVYRKDTIEVRNVTNGNIIEEIPTQIYRAPVVLVHGLWGDMTSMLTVFDGLLNSGKYNSSLVRVTDYSNTNAYSFLANSNVIKNEINSTFLNLRFSKYSAGKVDVVAHSMGGILSRIYLQNNDCEGGHQINCYRDDIHKLITLNTPHSGTQMPNFLFSSAWGAGLARDVLDYNGMYWNSGAVENLRCNSQEIGWLNGASLNNHIVPCYAIQTETSVGLSNAFNENALTNIIGAARNESGQDFNNEVFNFTPNDLIVPTNSQRGGLDDFDFIQGIMHTASPDDASVINTVKILLDENPSASLYFDQNVGGYDPPVIQPTFFIPAPDSDQNKSLNFGTVTITNPILGFTCSEGDIVQIDVNGSTNINHLIVTVSNKNTGVASFDTLANSSTFYFTVPNNIIGPVKIMAIGYDSTGFVDLDTLEILANPLAMLDSLGFVNDYINIPIGQSVPFTLFGYFSDLTIRNLSQVSNISYDVANTNVVSLDSNHIMSGLNIGTTFLHAQYQGKDAYTTINVYGGDDWTINFIPCPADSIVNESAVINVNHVKATFNSNGAMFSDFENGQFIAPYQSGQQEISTLRAAGVWLGGYDQGGNLKSAIQLYNENCKTDFATGTLSPDEGIATGQLQGIYRVTAVDIQQDLADFADNGVIDNPNSNVFGWPARGNPYFSQYHNGEILPDTDQGLAGFWDDNGDGLYNPTEGDYPAIEIRGCENHLPTLPDEMLWFVFNDELSGMFHSEGGGIPIRMEVQCQVFAYEEEDSPFGNTIFARYKLINRAKEDIDSTYFGVFADFDIGNPNDDFFGSDTTRSIMFGYNGDEEDEFGYGANAPVMAVDLIQGPLDENQQELKLAHVMPVKLDELPPTDVNYYRLLTGTDVFGLPAPNNGIFYPGNPNQPGSDSETSAGNTPGERKAIASYGPFILQPGAVNTLIVAYTYYQEPGNTPLQNVEAMYAQADEMQIMFDTCFGAPSGLKEKHVPEKTLFSIYPNPTTGRFTISLKSDEAKDVEILCTNLLGQSIFSKEYNLANGELKTELDLTAVGKGLYLIQVRSNGKSVFRKVTVIK